MGQTDLYMIRNGTITAVRYRGEIINPIVIPSASAVGPDLILIDDNVRPDHCYLLERETMDRIN